MARSFVAANARFILGGSTNTIATTSSFNVVAGDTIAVGVRNENTNVSILTMTDTAGNVYRQASHQQNSGTGVFVDVWYCTNCLAHAANIITVVFSAANGNQAISAIQLRGLATISPLDVSISISGNSTSIASPAFSTCLADEIIIAFAQLNSISGAWTPPAGYTQDATDASGVMAVAHKITSALEVGVTPTYTNSTSANATLNIISFHEEITSGGGGSGESSSVFGC